MSKKLREILSYSGVITNSSSETFTVKKPKDLIKERLAEEIRKHATDHMYWNFPEGTDPEKMNTYSGDCHDPIITDWEDEYKEFLYYNIPSDKRDRFTKEMWFLIRPEKTWEDLENVIWVKFDEGFKATEKWFLENYVCVGVDAFGYTLKNGKLERIKNDNDEDWAEQNYYYVSEEDSIHKDFGIVVKIDRPK